MHDISELRASARSLKAQMIEAGLISTNEKSRNLDALIAELDDEDFVSLRALPAFWELVAFWKSQTDIELTIMSQNNSESSHSIPPLSFQMNAKAAPSETDVAALLPHPKTLIGEVKLGGRFDKLIARLCRSATKSAGVTVSFDRLEDVLNLPSDSLFKLNGVGQSYRDDWQALKSMYFEATEFLPAASNLSDVAKLHELVCDDMRLNPSQLAAADLKAITKLGRVKGRADIRSILKFESLEAVTERRLGDRTKDQLMRLRARIGAELQLIADGSLDYRSAPSSLITTETQTFTSVAELGRFVLERLDVFLANLDDKSQLIFQYRWGFVDERLTLEEIGKKFDVSRERIRQLEGKINKQLNNCLALDSLDIWHDAMMLSEEALRLEMADLFECFPERSHFYDFLGFISHGRIAATVLSASPSRSILDSYFAMHGTTIQKSVVLQFLQQELGGYEKDATNLLKFLHDQNQVAFEGESVRPLNLGKHEAAAAVLAEHPNGLPWLDIARHANIRGLSRTPFSEQTRGNALQDSDLMYVAGKGVYRHSRFVDFSVFDKPAIFCALHSYFASSEREVAHLSEAHVGMPDLRKHDYFIIRYIVKMHGEDHGVFFNGKSQTDTISLNPEFNLISQKNVILQAMLQRQEPLTSNEIAQLLKSRSAQHAMFYLKQLMDSNLVVQVDRMLYTTPDIAYKNIDLDAMRNSIESVLRYHDKPVDPSIIQQELNALQNEAYSKYFYSSLARYFSQLGHWKRAHSLFSLQPIPFGSLNNVVDTLCKAENTFSQNYASLSLHIAINEESAKVAINNWSAAKARLVSGTSVSELEDELEGEPEID